MALLNPLRRVRCLWLSALAFACLTTWAATGPTEYQVKAVFLFNFAHFVEWPANTFRAADAPFIIGILGTDPFGATLDDVLRGETVDHHPLLVKRFRDPGEIADCNILFIGQVERGRLDEALAALKGHSVLTVSNADASGQHGVMIQMLTENNRIRLRIDLAAARTGNLTISSNLLRSAEIVGANPREGDQ